MSAVTLHGFPPSVYTWVAHLALAARGVAVRAASVDPFAPADAARLAALHPFGRVPILEHDGARIYETAAILAYIDAAFDGPPLAPAAPLARARAVQVGAIVDAYGYWPLVRQVFGEAVFRPALGETADAERVAAGLAAAEPVLAALETIAAEGLVLTGRSLTLADCHLYPMIDYFAEAPAGAAALARRPALARWYEATTDRAPVRASRPDWRSWVAGHWEAAT